MKPRHSNAAGTRIRLAGGGKVRIGDLPPVGVAATSVSITDFPDMTFRQRVGTSKTVGLDIGFTGTPSLLEWRLVDWYTGTPRTSWATLVTNPPTSPCTVNVTYPQGPWDKIQVRCGVNTAITASTNNKHAVGIAIAMLGQSNMAGRPGSNGGDKPLGDRRLAYLNGSNAIARAGNVNDSMPANTTESTSGYYTGLTVDGSSSGDGFIYFGNLVAQAQNCVVLMVNRAINATSITTWLTGGTSWNAFTPAIAAIGGDFEMCLWHQGEQDAGGMTKATMKTNLGLLHGQLKTLAGRSNANFHFGIVGLGIGSYNGSQPGDFGKIRAAHAEFVAETAGTYYSTSAHDTYTGDGVHLGALMLGKVARRDAKSANARLGVGVSGAGPRILTATRSGTTVTCPVTHSGGTALQDGAGGSGAALVGFEFKDAGAGGAVIATAATAISGNTVVLTLASAPVGALTLSYAMANNPHSVDAQTAPVLAGIVYDNATYYGSGTLGCTLQPFAAITVP